MAAATRKALAAVAWAALLLLLATTTTTTTTRTNAAIVSSAHKVTAYFATATCPAGWNDTATDDRLRGRIIKGVTNAATVGVTVDNPIVGSAPPKHKHGAYAVQISLSTVPPPTPSPIKVSAAPGPWNAAPYPASGGPHVLNDQNSAMTDSEANVQYVALRLCFYADTAANFSLPKNTVVFVHPDKNTCPPSSDGWDPTDFVDANGRFLVFSTPNLDFSTTSVVSAALGLGNATRVGNAHQHTFSPSPQPVNGISIMQSGTTAYTGAFPGTPAWTQSSAASPASMNIPYVQLKACRASSDGPGKPVLPPTTSIFFFDGYPCPSGWIAAEPTRATNISGRLIVNADNSSTVGVPFGSGALLTLSDTKGHSAHSHVVTKQQFMFAAQSPFFTNALQCSGSSSVVADAGSGCPTSISLPSTYNININTDSEGSSSYIPYRLLTACSPGNPTTSPSRAPSTAPSKAPSRAPSRVPSDSPSKSPSRAPSRSPSTSRPTRSPSKAPSTAPSRAPSRAPTVPLLKFPNGMAFSTVVAVENSLVSLPIQLLSTREMLQVQASATFGAACPSPTAGSTNAVKWLPLNPSLPALYATNGSRAVNLGSLTTSVTIATDTYASPTKFDGDSTSVSKQACVLLAVSSPATNEAQNFSIPVTAEIYAPCRAGRFEAATGSNRFSPCSPCVHGSFADAAGATACTPCPANSSYTLSVGSASASDCVRCPLGYYCPLGQANPQPCPAGAWESIQNGYAAALAATDCERRACSPGFWCGPGAAENATYRLVLDLAPLAPIFVPAKARIRQAFIVTNRDPVSPAILKIDAANNVPAWLLGVSTSPTDAPLSQVTLPPNAATPVYVVVDAAAAPNSPSTHTHTLNLAWSLPNDASLYTADFSGLAVNVTMNVVEVVVSPKSFSLTTDLGTKLDTSTTTVQLFNTLCDNDITYTVVPGCSTYGMTTLNASSSSPALAGETMPNWFTFTTPINQPITIPQKRGTPDDVVFQADFSPASGFTLPPPPADGTRARPQTACFTLRVSLDGLGVVLLKHVNVSALVVQKCPAGTFSLTTDDTTGCSRCPVNTFQDKPGSTACTACTAYRSDLPVTLQEGATSSADCVAAASSLQSLNGSAVACPEGANCTAPGVTLCTMAVRRGFWRTTPESLNVLKCPNGGVYCKGGAFEDVVSCEVAQHVAMNQSNFSSSASGGGEQAFLAARSTRRLLSTTTTTLNSSDLCIPHHQGIFCEQCQPGFFKRGVDHICSPCADAEIAVDGARVAGIFTGIFAALLLTCGVVYYRHRISFMERTNAAPPSKRVLLRKKWERFFDAVDVGVKLRIIVGLLQVMGGMSVVFAVQLPPFFQDVQKAFQVLCLNLLKVMDFGCVLQDQTHYAALLFATLLPLCAAAALGAFHLILERTVASNDVVLRSEIRAVSFTLLLLIMFLCYPSTSNSILSTYACVGFDDGTFTLSVDHSVVCYDARWAGFAFYAAVMAILYVVGVPAFYFAVLWRERDRIAPLAGKTGVTVKVQMAVREKDRSIMHSRFLWRPYKPAFWWVEVFELGRKLAQTSVIVFVGSGQPELQAVYQLVITIVSVVLMNTLMPYAERSNNLLAIASLWVIFSISFLALIKQLSTGRVYDRDAIDGFMIALFFLVPFIAVSQIVAEIFTGEAYRLVCCCVDWDRAFQRHPRLFKCMKFVFGVRMKEPHAHGGAVDHAMVVVDKATGGFSVDPSGESGASKIGGVNPVFSSESQVAWAGGQGGGGGPQSQPSQVQGAAMLTPLLRDALVADEATRNPALRDWVARCQAAASELESRYDQVRSENDSLRAELTSAQRVQLGLETAMQEAQVEALDARAEATAARRATVAATSANHV